MPSPLSGASAGVESIRTLALVGPAAAGKTSLAEALLAAAGAIVTPGSARARHARSATSIRSSGACSIRSTPACCT